MTTRQLKQQLKQMVITKAVAGVGTSEGYPAVFLRWNGDEEVFTGADETTHLTRWPAALAALRIAS